ncbi:unnamed protein product, partial [Iphiclides podalirius]
MRSPRAERVRSRIRINWTWTQASKMSESPGYTVAPVLAEDHEEVMKLLKRTFFVDEPLNRTLGIYRSESESCPELEEFCSSSLHEGLSLKAVDGDGRIIAVLINETCPIRRAETSADPKFQKILYILARREEGTRLWEKFPKENKLVEVKVAATDARWRHRGIMNALVMETEKLLKGQGVRLMRLDTSSAYSAKSAERMGFECFYRVRYKDIQMDGQPLVVPELPHEYDCVFVKKLY